MAAASAASFSAATRDALLDPISREPLLNPVVLACCGNSLSRATVRRLVLPLCPFDSSRLCVEMVVRNRALEALCGVDSQVNCELPNLPRSAELARLLHGEGVRGAASSAALLSAAPQRANHRGAAEASEAPTPSPRPANAVEPSAVRGTASPGSPAAAAAAAASPGRLSNAPQLRVRRLQPGPAAPPVDAEGRGTRAGRLTEAARASWDARRASLLVACLDSAS
jgi:hypothetical protein